MNRHPQDRPRRTSNLALGSALAGFVLVFGVLGAFSAEPCGPAAEVTEIAPGVFVRPGKHAVVFEQSAVANVGFIVGERCVAVVDTGGSYAEGEALGCAIRRVTKQPVCYVINTHGHPDHMLGNLAFKQQEVEFIGHAKLPRAMAMRGGLYLERAEAAAGRPLGPEHIVLPDRTVDEELTLDLGARTLRLTAHRSAHTDHDLTVFDDKTDTLWLSDLLFVEHIPVIDASINGWIDVIGTLADHAAARAVPGHGPPQAPWPEAGREMMQYFAVLRDEIRTWIADGGDLGAAQEKVGYAEKGKWRLFHGYHKRNIAAAYAELEWED